MKKTLKLLAILSIFASTLVIPAMVANAAYTDLESFYRSSLSQTISSTATSVIVATAPTVSTGYLVIEPRTPNQEIVKMTSRSGTTLTVVRGLSATSSSPVDAGYKRSHAAGSAIEMVDVHYYIRELQNLLGGLTADSPTFVVDYTNHRVGMGTTSPNALLNLYSATATSGSSTLLTLEPSTNTASSTRISWSRNSDNWTPVSIGQLYGAGSDYGGALAFYTHADDGVVGSFMSALERMRILANGNVGIGTTTPGSLLSVAGVSDFLGNMNLTGYKITNLGTPSDATDAANKDYVDNVSINGAPVAENGVTGIVRTATSTQIATGYSSTTAYVISSSFASSTASSTTIVVATKAATGKIDPSFLNGSTEEYTFNGTTTFAGPVTITGTPSILGFGNGVDGNATISATTTLTSDMFYNNLTLSASGELVTNGYKVYVANTLSGSGLLNWGNPTVGGTGGDTGSCSGGGAGSAGGSSGSGQFKSAPGGAGSAGSGAITSGIATSTGGTGGNGAATGFGTGAGAGAVSVQNKVAQFANMTLHGVDISYALGTTTAYKSGTGGGGGGAGGTNGGCGGAGGGGGGAGGGVVLVAAKNWAGTFTIKSVGALGGNGGNGGGSSGSGGGGGGGAGGSSIMVYGTKTWTGLYNLVGGAGGNGGTGGGGAGNNGSAGGAGTAYEVNINNLIR